MGDDDPTKAQLGEIDTDIERLFYAARHAVPNAADELSGAATHLAHALNILNVQSAKTGDPAIMQTMLKLGEAIFDQLRIGVESANNFAAAIEATAQDYRRVDGDAYADMAPFIKKLQEDDGPAYVPGKLDDRLGPPGATDTTPFTGPVPPGQVRPDVEVPVPQTGAPEEPDADADQRQQNQNDSEQSHNEQERNW